MVRQEEMLYLSDPFPPRVVGYPGCRRVICTVPAWNDDSFSCENWMVFLDGCETAPSGVAVTIPSRDCAELSPSGGVVPTGSGHRLALRM